MIALLLLINALVAIAMIILILLQRTDASGGGVFGGSSGNTPVVRNPLAKPTAVLAGIFLFLSLVLAYLGHHGAGTESTLMNAPLPVSGPANPNGISGTEVISPSQTLPLPGQGAQGGATPAPAPAPAPMPAPAPAPKG